jgi:ParD-like antitoxin of type II bacterial toxin-antitoxin system
MLQNMLFCSKKNEVNMAKSDPVRISEDLFNDAKRYGLVQKRSVAGQVEYWARLGKVASDNSDLPFAFIEKTMISLAEAKDGLVTPLDLDAL